MSSGSSSDSSSSPAPTRKRKKGNVELSDNSDDHNTSDEGSSTSRLEDAPQRLPPTDDTVLSHAERRRQKKKQKHQQKQLSAASEPPRKKRKLDEASTKAKDTATDDPRRQKRQNSVWVGNLSFRTTQDALREFFDGVGTITRIHMPMRRGKEMQGESMGFAYVDFETPDAKVIAVTLSEGNLDGRRLLIKDGDDFTGRPAKANAESLQGNHGEKLATKPAVADGKGLSKTAQKILRAQKQPPAPTLFLGNLGFDTTEESIRELFEAHRYWKHGDKEKEGDQVQCEDGVGKSEDVWIRKVRMGTFEDSGTCKGFAFVDFTSIEHATEALMNPRNHRLNGRDLVVEYASPDAVRRGGGPRNPKISQDQKGRGRGGDKSARVPHRGSTNTLYANQRQPRSAVTEDVVDSAPAEVATTTRSRRPDGAGRDRTRIRRARPGAALAQAQRQSAAILPSQGQKIVF